MIYLFLASMIVVVLLDVMIQQNNKIIEHLNR